MALDEELKKLKNLTPIERIRKIKELEEEKKKEIEEAEKLLRETQKEAEEEADEKRKLPAPQMKAIDSDSLETIEAKLLWAAKRGVSLAPKEREETSLPAERKEPEDISERVEESRGNKGQQIRGTQYFDRINEAMQEKRLIDITETYNTKISTSVPPEDVYEAALPKKEISQLYQRPEPKTEITYQIRKATPGHERETSETQDFYTRESKKRNR